MNWDRLSAVLSGVEQGETLRRALKVKVNAGGEGECRLFDCVQATWNVLEPSAGAALLEAHQAGRACQILRTLVS